jgi:hypothetical protein
MATNSTHQTKGTKEELLELLKKKPKIYQDAVKWTLARWSGISFSSLFDNVNSQVERERILNKLKKDDCFRIIDDPKGSSEAIVQVTEKGRDSMINLFYSEKDKRMLKRLLRRLDAVYSS